MNKQVLRRPGPDDDLVSKMLADPNWQRFWLELEAQPWRVLALLAADADVPVATLGHAMAALGGRSGRQRFVALDETSCALTSLDEAIERVHAAVTTDARVLLALSDVQQHPVSLRLAKAANSCLLCVQVPSTRIANASKAVEEIGKERFLGTLVLE